MAASRILVDTNVALDWLLDRKPWSDEAQPLWASQDGGQAILCLAASVLDTIYYIIRKGRGHEVAKQAIQRCIAALAILPVDVGIIQQALLLAGNDFEDNVLIACAVAAGLDMIATRDADGFGHSPVPAFNPRDIKSHLPPAL